MKENTKEAKQIKYVFAVDPVAEMRVKQLLLEGDWSEMYGLTCVQETHQDVPRQGEFPFKMFSPADRIHLMIERVKCCDESVTLALTSAHCDISAEFIYKSKDCPVRN